MNSRISRIPKSMPSDRLLQMIVFPPPQTFFQKTVDAKTGAAIDARIPEATQNELKQILQMAGLPEYLQLFPREPQAQIAKPLVRQPSKEDKRIKKLQRIEANLKAMPERIAKWKEDKRRKRIDEKPEMPF